MKYSTSLKLNHVFQRLYHTSGAADSYLAIYARKNRTGQNRVGITTSKKLGHAVQRNRTRRRLREVYRLNEERFQPSWDIVVVRLPSTASRQATFGCLQNSESSGKKKSNEETAAPAHSLLSEVYFPRLPSQMSIPSNLLCLCL